VFVFRCLRFAVPTSGTLFIFIFICGTTYWSHHWSHHLFIYFHHHSIFVYSTLSDRKVPILFFLDILSAFWGLVATSGYFIFSARSRFRPDSHPYRTCSGLQTEHGLTPHSVSPSIMFYTCSLPVPHVCSSLYVPISVPSKTPFVYISLSTSACNLSLNINFSLPAQPLFLAKSCDLWNKDPVTSVWIQLRSSYSTSVSC